MLESSLVYIFTRTFPESLILVLSGVILLGINIDKKKIFKYGIILGIIIGIIRLLPITFGVHSVLSMIVLCIILCKCANNDIVNVERLTDNTTLQGAIITLPSLLIMFLIVLLLRYIKDNILKFKIRG